MPIRTEILIVRPMSNNALQKTSPSAFTATVFTFEDCLS